MRLSDGMYDKLKWFALAFIPAFEVLILTLGKIWAIPYYSEIGATVAAVGVFIAAIIGVTSKNYYEDLAMPTDDDYIELLEEDPGEYEQEEGEK